MWPNNDANRAYYILTNLLLYSSVMEHTHTRPNGYKDPKLSLENEVWQR